MVTEGQTATEEAAQATQEGAPPTDPPAAPKPSEEYKGLQRANAAQKTALDTQEKEIADLKQQIATRPATQPVGPATVETQADNYYWQYFNAAKARGAEDATAQAEGNAAKVAILWQASQAEVAELRTREQEQTLAHEAQRVSDALLSELRDQARDAGVDPHDPLLDYGEGSQDAATRMGRLRRSIPEVRKVRAEAQASAPAEPTEAPDHSAERIDSTGSTSPPSGDGERKKQTYLAAYEAYKNGAPGALGATALKALYDEAKVAGAEF